MKVLVACEFSGIVRDAFAARGHDAWSCDLLPSERPGKHIQGDVLDQLDAGWDLMVAHPPCTAISNMSNCRIREPGRLEMRREGMEFFLQIASTDIARTAIENPRGLPERTYRRADQIIQPWQFGHTESKATCLWLKGLPLLRPTQIVEHTRQWVGGRWRTWTDTCTHGWNVEKRRKHRSRTFQGIADAMAEQWGGAA